MPGPLFSQSDDEGSIEISSPVPSIITRSNKNEQSWLGKQTIRLGVFETETVDKLDLTVPNTEVQIANTEPTDYTMDEFAELEAWLESGSVEIV